MPCFNALHLLALLYGCSIHDKVNDGLLFVSVIVMFNFASVEVNSSLTFGPVCGAARHTRCQSAAGEAPGCSWFGESGHRTN